MATGALQTGSATASQMPATFMLPYIGQGLSSAAQLYANGGPEYYPGNSVAGFSEPQQQAMAAIQQLGMNGTPALSAAQGFDQALLNGGGSNPYLDQMFRQAAGATQNQLASEFARAGRNTAASEPLRTEQLNNLATSLYGGNYQASLADALNAGNQAQSLYGTQLRGLGAAEGVGQQVQNQAQKLIDGNMAKYNYYQQLPEMQLQQFDRNIAALQPGSQQSNPITGDPVMNALNTARAMEQIYNGMGSKGGQGGN